MFKVDGCDVARAALRVELHGLFAPQPTKDLEIAFDPCASAFDALHDVADVVLGDDTGVEVEEFALQRFVEERAAFAAALGHGRGRRKKSPADLGGVLDERALSGRVFGADRHERTSVRDLTSTQPDMSS